MLSMTSTVTAHNPILKTVYLTKGVQATLDQKGYNNTSATEVKAWSSWHKPSRKIICKTITTQDFKDALTLFQNKPKTALRLKNGLLLSARKDYGERYQKGFRRWRAKVNFIWNRWFGGFKIASPETGATVSPIKNTDDKSKPKNGIQPLQFQFLDQVHTFDDTDIKTRSLLESFTGKRPFKNVLTDFEKRHQDIQNEEKIGKDYFSEKHVGMPFEQYIANKKQILKKEEQDIQSRFKRLSTPTSLASSNLTIFEFCPEQIDQKFYALCESNNPENPYLFSINLQKNMVMLYPRYAMHPYVYFPSSYIGQINPMADYIASHVKSNFHIVLVGDVSPTHDFVQALCEKTAHQPVTVDKNQIQSL